jgi:hypothetical protein
MAWIGKNGQRETSSLITCSQRWWEMLVVVEAA